MIRPCPNAQRQAVIVVVGGLNMDLVAFTPRFPEPGETVVGNSFVTYPGGKGGNQAVAAARVGAQVMMVGRVGSDPFGQQLLDSLHNNGVNVDGVGIEQGSSSGIASITIDSSGQNRIVQIPGANQTCSQQEIQAAIDLLPRASAVMLQF